MTPARRCCVPFALALFLIGQGGCLGRLHPVAPPGADQFSVCQQIPQQCRQRVYVFFINGLDPLDYANLRGVRDHMQALGYIKTYHGHFYHAGYFADEIRRLHEVDPQARFALVGFNYGANKARDIANEVRYDNIPIDLVVYLGGTTLTNDAEVRPDNVLRAVNVQTSGWTGAGLALDHAENVHYDDVWYFASPTHPQTLERLTQELTDVAARIPFVESRYPPLQTEPTPRPVMQPAVGNRDEWDFLLPGDKIPELPPRPAQKQSVAKAPEPR